jgi:HEAT repeat protein
VAGSALAALGATRDSRLVEPLRALPWPEGEGSIDLRLERARALLRLGDWQTVPILIEGLRDERMITRALSSQALWESTHERFGYDPKGEEAERAASIAKWEAWWKDRSIDPLQTTGKSAAPAPATSDRSDG